MKHLQASKETLIEVAKELMYRFDHGTDFAMEKVMERLQELMTAQEFIEFCNVLENC